MRPRRLTSGYAAVLAASLGAALFAGWLPLASKIDGAAYDWFFRLHPPKPAGPPQAVVLAIDEESLARMGGMRELRRILGGSLNVLSGVKPAAVALDVSLFDEGEPAADQFLETALCRNANVVLAAELTQDGARWQEPLARFRRCGAVIAHVHSQPDPVNRAAPLEMAAGRVRRWAMSVETLRLASGEPVVRESPGDLRIGALEIPARRDQARALLVRYLDGGIPSIPAWQASQRAGEFTHKAVFVGITAISAARDRLMTPFERMMTGVEIHAQAYETMRQQQFLVPVSLTASVFLMLGVVAASGAIFAFLAGWRAYVLGALLIAAGHAIVHIGFVRGAVLPYTGIVASAWLSVGAAAAWQHFVVRGQLARSEADKSRYQQAIHFVTHEMRSPLTAIQGSSELMGRYNLNEEKRRQMAGMINSESKRLAQMIQTFLNIERLTAGEMEVKAEPIEIEDLIATCVQRAAPLAERKDISLSAGTIEPQRLSADRELIEYALYNLLTNAVKYSPAGTTVAISARRDGERTRISVADQGIGMDDKELGKIFTRFYRTRRAEASGEAGTGIGLSIVDHIVSHHGGRMEVTSEPGKGSCFTMVLPRQSHTVPASQARG